MILRRDRRLLPAGVAAALAVVVAVLTVPGFGASLPGWDQPDAAPIRAFALVIAGMGLPAMLALAARSTLTTTAHGSRSIRVERRSLLARKTEQHDVAGAAAIQLTQRQDYDNAPTIHVELAMSDGSTLPLRSFQNHERAERWRTAILTEIGL